MTSQKPLFFSSLIVGVLLLVAALISGYDASTIIEAEDDEEEVGTVLISANHWLSDIQEVRIALLRFLVTGKEENLVSYESKRYDAVKSFEGLQKILAEHLPEAMPQLRPLDDLQRGFLGSLDKAGKMRRDGQTAAEIQANGSEQNQNYVEQIRVFLGGLTEHVRKRQEAINARVSRSILRGSISFVLMTVIMMAVLVQGYRAAGRRIGTIQDLSERLEHEAMHDHLTGLPNRRYFNDWLSRSVSLAARTNSKIGLLLIDLDEFKQVNDRFGHDGGDEVLRTIAKRLQNLLRGSDFTVRLGGDELAVLIPGAQGYDQLSVVARRIIASVEEPIAVTGGMAKVGSSIGIAVYPDDAGGTGDLVKAADRAMYHAKDEGRNRYCFFGTTFVDTGTAGPERTAS